MLKTSVSQFCLRAVHLEWAEETRIEHSDKKKAKLSFLERNVLGYQPWWVIS